VWPAASPDPDKTHGGRKWGGGGTVADTRAGVRSEAPAQDCLEIVGDASSREKVAVWPLASHRRKGRRPSAVKSTPRAATDFPQPEGQAALGDWVRKGTGVRSARGLHTGIFPSACPSHTYWFVSFLNSWDDPVLGSLGVASFPDGVWVSREGLLGEEATLVIIVQ